MSDLVTTAALAAAVFAGTDVDDLLVLTVLFLSGRGTGRPRPAQVVAGQYLGVGALVAVSLVAAAGLLVVPDRWVGLLGLLPIALGVRGLWQAWGHEDDDEPPPVAGSVLAVAGITIANGADNLSVYTPMFRTLDPSDTAVTVLVFAAGVAVWCAAGAWLGSHRRVAGVVERSGHWLVPCVFVAIGVAIVAESGALTGAG